VSHEPDLNKIPESLRPLAWQPMYLNREWSDGQTLLVAVPVRNGRGSDWHYEFSIVRIAIDVEYFRVLEADETWGWDLDDADYFVEVRK